MRDTSVKTTSFHSATHILLPSHHWRRRRLWFCVKGRPNNGRLADRPLCLKITSHNRLDDSLRWRAVGRLEAGQSQVEVDRSLQVGQNWSPGCGINSKQVVLSPGWSANVATEHKHLHRIAASL
ncbi:hypothetical protein TNCV_2433031 [Trichonephila clavipes]|nr:hypothetical protein TNCV_2433031 [Trichonephila clavipes]